MTLTIFIGGKAVVCGGLETHGGGEQQGTKIFNMVVNRRRRLAVNRRRDKSRLYICHPIFISIKNRNKKGMPVLNVSGARG